MSPIQIHVLLAVYACGHPNNILMNRSQASDDALSYLEHEGLIHQLSDDSYEATAKGICLIEAITNIPMPVQSWSIPHDRPHHQAG